MIKKSKAILLSVAVLIILTACSIETELTNEGINATPVSSSTDIIAEVDLELEGLLDDNLVGDEDNTDINPEEIKGSTIDELIANFDEIITTVDIPMLQEDFDGDGFVDLAVVLEAKESEAGEAKNRTLLVASGREDGTYHFPEYHDHLIYKSDEGGVMGDPFMGLNYDEEYGTFGIDHYGGSNWRWSNRLHIKYIEQGWSVVGYSSETFNVHDGSGTRLEFDLSMGQIFYEIIDENGESEYHFPTAPVKGEILLYNFDGDEFSEYLSTLITIE